MYTDYNEEKEESYYADDDNKNNGLDKEKLKRIVFFVLVFVILIILIIILAKGCSKKTNNQENGNGVSYVDKKATVVFGKTNLTLNVGESEKIEADVLNRDSFELIWYQNDPTIVDIDEQGNITALSEGETEVFALYKENDIVVSQASCTVIVTEKEVPPEKISLGQDDISLKLGDTLLLQVSISPVEAKMSDIVFESDLPDIVSIDEKGYITANSVGKAKITAKSKDGNISDSITVTVTETGETEINPTNLILFGLSNGLTVGGTSKMEYKLLPDNATNTEITWTSSDPSIATVDDAIVTGHKVGKCIIIATTENGLSYQQEIIVESDAIPVTSISINGENSITIPLGGTRLLSYKILPENATNKNVSYTVNNSSVLFVDSNGFIAAIGVGNSLVTITTEDGKKTAIVNVTVTNNSSSSNSNESRETITGNSPGGSVDGTNTTDNSSSSNDVSDTSSNDSSSSTSSDSSSSSNASSSSVSTSTCSSSSIDVSSNQGKNTSTNGFSGAIPFTNSNPGLKVNTIDNTNCTITYSLYKGTNANNVNTLVESNKTFAKQGSTHYLKISSGYKYYKYVVTIKPKDGSSVTTKYYYMIVNNSTTNSIASSVNITIQALGSNKYAISKASGSSANYVYYCQNKTSVTCNPKTGSKFVLSNSTVNKVFTYSKGSKEKVCFMGYNSSSKIWSGMSCYSLVDNNSAVPSISSISMQKSGSKVQAKILIKNIESNLQVSVCNKVGSACTNYAHINAQKASEGYTVTYDFTAPSKGKKVYVCIKAVNKSNNKSSTRCSSYTV